MKRCAKCSREYIDDTLRFCLDDGTPLSDASYRGEAPATQILQQRTTASPSPAIPSPTIPTIPSYSARNSVLPEQHQARRSNPILIAGVIAIVLLLGALVALAGYFVYTRSGEDDEAKTNNNQSEPSRKKGSPSDPDQNTNQGPSPEPTDSKTTTPLKITASASSVRLAVQSNTYYPSNAIDGKRTTAWIEGADGPGLGEWIRFDFDREINLHRILFQPGYFKSSHAWTQNNRLASVTAQFSDGTTRELRFDDRMESQKLEVGNVRTRWVRFVINSVYYGTDPDTALSEIAFEWDQ